MSTAAENKVKQRLYRLRWRFCFAGKPDRRGIWNGASGRPEDGAWAVPKEGLLGAIIEGEDFHTHEVKKFLEIPGEDYVTAQWEAYARIPGFMGVESVTRAPNIYGLSFKTREEKITVAIDGRVHRRPLSEEEKKFKLKEHTAGSLL